MATTLARQLAQIASSSKSSLNVKAQKASHSRSLIWEPAVAATQSIEAIYAVCSEGFAELCQLDPRFAVFAFSIFSEQSLHEDRTQLTAAENAELDRHVEAFLRLVGGRLRLMPAIKSVEWLVRRFKIHDYTTSALITTFLPYHSTPAFVTLLSILPAQLPAEYRFLGTYARALQSPPRAIIVHRAIQDGAFLTSFSEYTLESCRAQQQYPGLIAFWGGVVTEAVNGLLDKNRSGRVAVQSANDQDLLYRLGPVFGKALAMKKVPSVQVAAYMALAVFVSKGGLEDAAISAFMEQLVYGWTSETARPGLLCLAIMAQHRAAKQMSAKVAKALLKVAGIGDLLADVGRQQRVDRLASGFCLALVDRLSAKGDARGLPVISRLLSGNVRVLREKQATVVIKSLLVAAHRIDGALDKDGSLRKALGAALVSMQEESTGPSSALMKRVLEEVGFDIEELEVKLNVVMQAGSAAPRAEQPGPETAVAAAPPTVTREAVEDMIGAASSSGIELPNYLAHAPDADFDGLGRAFVAAISLRPPEPLLLVEFAKIKPLDAPSAFENYVFVAFFVRIWCGPYPALARAAALDMVDRRLKEGSDEGAAAADCRFLIPYCIAALSDRSQRVRRSAMNLLTCMAGHLRHARAHAHVHATPDDSARARLPLYACAAAAAAAPPRGLEMPSETASKLLDTVLVASAEECFMHEDHIHAVLPRWLGDGGQVKASEAESNNGGRLGKHARNQIISFLSAHVVSTPLLVVKERLLRSLNAVRSVSTSARTSTLLASLRWWAALSPDEARTLCLREKVDEAVIDERLVGVTIPGEQDRLSCFLEVVKGDNAERRVRLVEAVFARIQKAWPLLKPAAKAALAPDLLELSQGGARGLSGRPGPVATEAAGLLQTVELPTDILLGFLATIQMSGAKMLAEPPPNKRRRTGSSSDVSRGQAPQRKSVGADADADADTDADADADADAAAAAGTSAALRRVTFVLQLVEGSDPARHAALFAPLFGIMAELQHLRSVVGSELGYLQGTVLRSLLALVPVYRADGSPKIDGSAGYGDLLVNCVQKSSSPSVQNAALLLIAGLAAAAPELVLHSVMPIFTFMGTSVLRQNDDYSAHVVSQTIREVVPPLITSLRRGQKNLMVGASELLVSFTTAYEHIPPHRREALFISLAETLGPREFLFALVAMLVDRYGPADGVLRFAADVLGRFGVETQLESLAKLLDLVGDLLRRSRAGLSSVLLGFVDDGGDGNGGSGNGNGSERREPASVAARQLAALPALLASRTLRAEFERLAAGGDDMEASKIRDLYAGLLENALLLADSLGDDQKALRNHCGSALAGLLNLLAIGELVKVVEGLLDRPNAVLRQKVLRAVEARVDRERVSDPEAQAALLAFLPQLTALIRESADVAYKSTAVACVGKIAQKYGRRDPEAVAAAASTIAGAHCLGHGDKALRVLSMRCLASLVDVLRDAIMPVLPGIVPQALGYMRASLGGAEPDAELHAAGYAVVTVLAQHLPYMMSAYLDDLLQIAGLSAESGLDDATNESRVSCLRFLAKQLDAGEFFAALDRNWSAAAAAGFTSISQYMDILRLALDHHPKSTVAKHIAPLSSIVASALELRRQAFLRDDLDPAASRHIDAVERATNEVALKMIYKLNDASFRPVFAQLVEWASSSSLKGREAGSRNYRLYSLYGFLLAFFDNLKSIVTIYATYIVDDAAKLLRNANLSVPIDRDLWCRVLAVLARCFEHDQDDFWQAPSHFAAVAPVLVEQFPRVGALAAAGGDAGGAAEEDLREAVARLAAAADSQAHRKELNGSLLRHLRSEKAAVRLAVVRCQQVLTERVGEEWLTALPEMLPYIGELQDDDDETVERETHRWIVKIEGVLGESLDSMLQ